MIENKKSREQLTKNTHNNAEMQEDSISEATIKTILNNFISIAKDTFKKMLKSENIEKYKDMIVSKVNTIKNDKDEIVGYTYDVYDKDTNDVYEGLTCRSSDKLSDGSMVRVYISNIIYIGFKI